MNGPHQNQPVYQIGAPLEEAAGVMILIHGRGASAHDILTLAGEFGRDDFAYLAPQAAGYTWYPQSFLASIEANEPGISSGIEVIVGIIRHIEEAGIAAGKIFIGGFSQGACLALETVARHARRYGGVFAFSGGLIGPEGTPRDYTGSLEGTPVFLGCSDIDPHIPQARVEFSADIMGQLGGAVTIRIYPQMGHTVNQDEIAFVQGLIGSVA